jgi:hypothetical protein
MIGGQRIQVGLPHAGKTAEITIEADTYHITVEDDLTFTAPRTNQGLRGPQLMPTQRPHACVP